MNNLNTSYSIWLPSLQERSKYIDTLELVLQKKIIRYPAYNGKEYTNFFKGYTHILPREKITDGMIGCLLSHIDILTKINENENENKNKYVIYEDDCEFVGNLDELEIFLNTISEYDLICLGANEYVDFVKTPNKNIVGIQRFWGTHSLLITSKAAKAILNTYSKYNEKKIFLPADWLYSYAIKENNLLAYGPRNPKQFFKQVSGLMSSINGNIRV